jgi:F-type H+-transporting ATPase subunit gamma
MAEITEIEARLNNLRAIEHLIRSMRAMAAIRWRRARHRLGQAQTYAAEVQRQLNVAIQYPSRLVMPAARVSPLPGTTGLIIITSDRGLCGAFNLSLVGFANDVIAREQALGHQVRIIALGRYGQRYFRRSPHQVIYTHPLPLIHAISFTETRETYERVEDLYQEGAFEQLHLIYNSFVSFGRYRRVEVRLLPPELTVPPRTEVKREHIVGSDTAELQRYLLAEYLAVQVHLGLVESMVSEQSARLQTMDTAMNNTQDRIDRLELEHNTARQESITQEVLEISAGTEALGLRKSRR